MSTIYFPSYKEAYEYCKENGLNPHGIFIVGTKYVVGR